MPTLPIISSRQLIKILSKLGYREVRQRGSHIRLESPNRKSETVPNYRTIDRSLLRKILRDTELTVRKFIDIYQN